MTFEIYKEHILDLYKNPLNKGNLENFTHEFIKNNPLCGDEIKIQLMIKDKKIMDAKFNGSGCVISQASASLITEKIKKMRAEEVKKLNKEEILNMLQIPISPARLNCALLSLEAVKGALQNKGC